MTEGKEKLRTAIVDSFVEHRRRYGSRRLLSELQEQGYAFGLHQPAELMKAEGLQAIQPRSFVPRTTDSRHRLGFSPNLLLNTSAPSGPNQVWISDITYIALANGRWS